MDDHPLRRRIIISRLVNDMVNRGGITFAHRAQDETGADPEQVVRAFIVCREIFGLDSFVAEVEQLDNKVPTEVQTRLYLTFRRLIDRSVRWFLQSRPSRIDIGAEIDRFRPAVQDLAPQLVGLAVGQEATINRLGAEELIAAGVPADLAGRAASLLTQFMVLDVAEVASTTGVASSDVARLHLILADRYGISALLAQITRLSRGDRWQALARGALRYDLYRALRRLTEAVLTNTPGSDDVDARIRQWEQANRSAVDRTQRTVQGVRRLEQADIAAVSVAMQSLRSVVQSS